MKFNRSQGKNRKWGGKKRFHSNKAGGHNIINPIESHSKSSDCVECKKSAPAYKCPACFLKYCSAGCCAEHRNRCRLSSASPKPVVTSTAVPRSLAENCKQRCTYEFPTEDTVPLEKLIQLKDDERIHDLLKSARLRHLITKLDDMQNPTNSFRDIMKEPEFRAFSNTVLDIVGMKDEYNISENV